MRGDLSPIGRTETGMLISFVWGILFVTAMTLSGTAIKVGEYSTPIIEQIEMLINSYTYVSFDSALETLSHLTQY